jgi:hypothetical protein
VLAIILAACSPDHLDNGSLYLDGVELYASPPLGVSARSKIRRETSDAIEWWNDQVGAEVFYEPTPTPDITVSIGANVPFTVDPDTMYWEQLGIAYADYSGYDGLITGCEIIILDAILDDYETALGVVKHELGHCLGLADDPHSLDLNSIMSSPLMWRGEVTEKDLEIVREML